MTVKKHGKLITYVSERLAKAGTLSRKDRKPRKIRYNKKSERPAKAGPPTWKDEQKVRQGGPANSRGTQKFQKSKAHVSESEGGSAKFKRQ